MNLKDGISHLLGSTWNQKVWTAELFNLRIQKLNHSVVQAVRVSYRMRREQSRLGVEMDASVQSVLMSTDPCLL